MKLNFASVLIVLFLSVFYTLCSATEKPWIPLIDDTALQNGVNVISPKEGVRIEQGVLQPFGVEKKPAWDLDQWSCRFTLADSKPEKQTDGSVKYADPGKSIVFYPRNDDAKPGEIRPGFSLAVRGIEEYQNDYPHVGQAWPHLLIERPFIQQPRLTDLDAVRFRIKFRITEHVRLDKPGWSDSYHTGQCQCYLTVNNLNTESPGYGDYLWFGIPMFDERYDHIAEYKALDFSTPEKAGTGKFINIVGSRTFFQEKAKDGGWITIDYDVLPLLKEAVDSAWERGYLSKSKNIEDYGLGCMNLGWEVPGPINVNVDCADFSLEVKRK